MRTTLRWVAVVAVGFLPAWGAGRTPPGGGLAKTQFRVSPRLVWIPNPTFVRRPVFLWCPADGYRGYQLQVDTAGTFAAPLFTITTSDTQAAMAGDLPFGTLFWRVCHLNAGGEFAGSEYSDTGILRVVADTMPVPLPVVPNPTHSRTPLLAWIGCGPGTSYTVELSADRGFSSAYQASGITDTFWTVSPALTVGVLYWKVLSSKNSLASRVDSAVIVSDTLPLLDGFGGDQSYGTNPTFRWHSVPGAGSYNIEINRTLPFPRDTAQPQADESLKRPLVYGTTVDTQFLCRTNLSNCMYFWRVSSSLDPARFSGIDSVMVMSPEPVNLRQARGADSRRLTAIESGGRIRLMPSVNGRVPAGMRLYDMRGRAAVAPSAGAGQPQGAYAAPPAGGAAPRATLTNSGAP